MAVDKPRGLSVVLLKRRLLATAGAGVVLLCAGGCSGAEQDLNEATRFDRFPIYWLGETFEGHNLTTVDATDQTETVGLTYGACTPGGGLEPRCRPPLKIQISPLCHHLDAVTLPPKGLQRVIRGAPVGTQDAAPVLLTRRVQIKIYRGDQTDAGAAFRAFAALASLNDAPPVVSGKGRFPAPLPGVLEGERRCTDGLD